MPLIFRPVTHADAVHSAALLDGQRAELVACYEPHGSYDASRRFLFPARGERFGAPLATQELMLQICAKQIHG